MTTRGYKVGYRIRGTRTSIPGGTVLGRPLTAGKNRGDVRPMTLNDLKSIGVASGNDVASAAFPNITAHSVVVAEGASPPVGVGPGAAGKPLLGAGAADPTFGTLGPVGGGTGLATLPAHNVLLGEGTSNVAGAAPSTAGAVLMSNGPTTDPSFQAIPPVGYFIPLVDGSEPPNFITDGDGSLILVAGP